MSPHPIVSWHRSVSSLIRPCVISLGVLLAPFALAVAPPSITSQPQGLSLTAGQAAIFQVNASGTGPLTYQWRKDGSTLPGGSASRFSINRVSVSDAGNYNVWVKEGDAEVLSDTVALAVAPTQYPGLLGIDPGFSPAIEGLDVAVNAVVRQVDGKLVLGGKFVRVNGVARCNLVRIDPNGVVDPSFDPGGGTNAPVSAIALQANGKILIGGEFTGCDGTTRNGIARLNPDGSVDTGFIPGSGVNGQVLALAVQPDGKVILGGGFNQYNGKTSPSLARVSASGVFDATFATGTGSNGYVYSIVQQADGKIVVGGSFQTFNGTACPGLVRLNTDGAIDTGFKPPSSAGSSHAVYAIGLAADNKLVIADTGAATFLRRLNADGSVDATFSSGAGPNGYVAALAMQSDGGLTVGGSFTSFDGQVRSHIARLKANGSLDPGFVPQVSIDGTVQTVLVGAQGEAIFAGPVKATGATAWVGLGRLRSNGSADANLAADLRASGVVKAAVQQPDGKYVVGGSFSHVGGAQHVDLARINPDGTVDGTFNPRVEADGWVEALALQPDGKIVAGGNFYSVNGVGRTHVARINPDGSLDAAFVPVGVYRTVYALLLQNDGRIVVGGSSQRRLCRLSATGMIEPAPAFIGGAGPDETVLTITSRPDGRMVITGFFRSYSGVARAGIAQLTADGALDPTFDVGSAVSGSMGAVLPMADGSAYVGGLFFLNGITQANIVRLTAAGAVDGSYLGRTELTTGVVGQMLRQADGKILTGQWVNSSMSPLTQGFCRALATGAADPTFNVTALLDAKTSRIFMQDDGRLIVTGGLFTDGALNRTGMARFSPHQAPTVSGTGAALFTAGVEGRLSLVTTGVPVPSFRISSGTFPSWARLDRRTGAISGTPPDMIGSPFQFSIVATNAAGNSAAFPVVLTVGTIPRLTTQPQGIRAQEGDRVVLSVQSTATPAATYQWRKNGAPLSGATSATLTIDGIGPADTGAYSVMASNSLGSTLSDAAIVGLTVPAGTKAVGAGREIGSNIYVASNGKTFDQVGLEGAAEAITADYDPDPTKNQITRTSYIDLDNDIVQVEFSGPGTLSLVLDTPTGPAAPVNYNQAATYMKGHVGIVITGATEQTNVSVFSVGRQTAVNQSLFKADVNYDGIADIAFIAIASANGKFGGVRTANANYFASKGLTGVYAPGVSFEGPVFIGDITAFDSATPVIRVGSVTDARIAGGDLAQANSAAVQVSGITQLKFTAGGDSHGKSLPVQTNKAVLQDGSGTDVTAQLVVYP